MRRILLADGLVELADEPDSGARIDAGAETESTATQVSDGHDADEEEPGEYFND